MRLSSQFTEAGHFLVIVSTLWDGKRKVLAMNHASKFSVMATQTLLYLYTGLICIVLFKDQESLCSLTISMITPVTQILRRFMLNDSVLNVNIPRH